MKQSAEGERILVGDGGGQLGTFLWGILVEFHRLGVPFDYWDKHIVTSASVFNSGFFLAQQIEEGCRMWLEHLPNGFWKFCGNDMRYLEDCLRSVEPLRYWLFRKQRTQVFVALTNRATLQSELVCLNDAPDPIRLMLASVAQPYLTGPRQLNGQFYYDASLTSQPPIDHLTKFKAKEVLVLMTVPEGYRENSVLYKLVSLCSVHDWQAGKLLWKWPDRRNKTLEEVESMTDIKVIRPSEPLPIGWRSRDKAGIQKTFELGKKAAQHFLEVHKL